MCEATSENAFIVHSFFKYKKMCIYSIYDLKFPMLSSMIFCWIEIEKM